MVRHVRHGPHAQHVRLGTGTGLGRGGRTHRLARSRPGTRPSGRARQARLRGRSRAGAGLPGHSRCHERPDRGHAGRPPAELQARIDQAVAKSVTVVEQRHAEQMADVLAAYDLLDKQFKRMYVVNTGMMRQ